MLADLRVVRSTSDSRILPSLEGKMLLIASRGTARDLLPPSPLLLLKTAAISKVQT